MNNANDACRNEFTEGQFDRMEHVVAEYKPVLAQGLPAPLILDERDGDEADPVVWTDETFEGEDVYLLAGGAVTVPSGANVVLKADAQGRPTTLFVNGTLTGEENITLLDGSEVVCRYGSNCDMGGGLTASGVAASGAGACILVREGGTARLGGTSVFSDNGLFVNAGGVIVLDDGALVEMARDAGRFEATPGSVFRFGAGVGIVIGGRADIHGTAAAPVVFEGDDLAAGQWWAGLTVDGDNASLSYVEVSGATAALDVRATDVTLDHVTATANSYGLRTDYAGAGCTGVCPPLAPATLTVTNSAFDGNASYGLYLRNATVTLRNTSASGNLHGVYASNATLNPLEDVVVAGNAADGVRVGSTGNVRLASPWQSSGSNRVTDNGDDEVVVASGGYLYVDVAPGNENVVAKACPPTAGHYLLEVLGDEKVLAESVYWGSPGGPPAGAFNDAALVDADPYLTADPDGLGVACRPGSGGAGWAAAERVPSGRAPSGGAPSGGAGSGTALRGGDFRAWLRAEIRAALQDLEGGPEAAGAVGLVRRLAYLQRLDADDELGEHGPTLGALRRLRQRLSGGEGLPAPLRGAAEAALRAEVHDALLRGAYATADSVLGAYGPLVEGEEERRALALASVAVAEQGGRYGEALATLEGVIAALPAGDGEYAADLALLAAAIAEHLGAGTRGIATGEAARAVTRGGEGEDLPAEYTTETPYPNPFSRTAALPVALPEAADVRVALYDVLGREVALVHAGLLEAGRHVLALDGGGLASGVYVVRASYAARGEVRVRVRRLTLVR